MIVRLGVGRTRLLRVLIRKTSASPNQKIMRGFIFWLLRALIRKTFAYQKDFCVSWSERFLRVLIRRKKQRKKRRKNASACLLDQKDFRVPWSKRYLRALIRKTFAYQIDFCVPWSERFLCILIRLKKKIKKLKSAHLDQKDICVPWSKNKNNKNLPALIRLFVLSL